MAHRTINLDLTTIGDNAYLLLGAFNRQARREGWTKKEIDAVRSEAKSGDFEKLLTTLMIHCDAEGAIQ